MRARKLLVVAALMGVVSMGLGCSSETTSTTTQSTGYASTSSESQPASQPQATTTTTTTTTSSEPDSVLGATFHLVGTIILLPFRIIGLLV